MSNFIEIVQTFFTNYGPALTAIAGAVVTALGVLKAVKTAIETLVGKNNNTLEGVEKKCDEVIAQAKVIEQQNIELKKANLELKEALTRVHQNEEV